MQEDVDETLGLNFSKGPLADGPVEGAKSLPKRMQLAFILDASRRVAGLKVNDSKNVTFPA